MFTLKLGKTTLYVPKSAISLLIISSAANEVWYALIFILASSGFLSSPGKNYRSTYLHVFTWSFCFFKNCM